MNFCQDKQINEAAGFYDLKQCGEEGRRMLCYKGTDYTLCSKHHAEFLEYVQRSAQ